MGVYFRPETCISAERGTEPELRAKRPVTAAGGIVVPHGVDALGGGEGDLARSVDRGGGLFPQESLEPCGSLHLVIRGVSQAVRLGAALGFRAHLSSWLPRCSVGRSVGLAPFIRGSHSVG